MLKRLINQASFKLQHFTGLTFIDNTHDQYNHYHYIFKQLILNNFILNQLKVNDTTHLQLGQVRAKWLRYLVTEMEVARIESSLMKETVAQVWMFFLFHFPYSCFVLLNVFHKRKGVISFALDIVHLFGDGPGLVLVSPNIFPACSAELSWFYHQTSLVILPLFLSCRFRYLHKLPCWSKYTTNLHLPVWSCISLLCLSVLQKVYCWFYYW